MLKIQQSIIDESAQNANAGVRYGVCKQPLCQDSLQEHDTQTAVFTPAICIGRVQVLKSADILSITSIKICKPADG